ncbi:putative phage tail protein [Apilactobacillus xinyiensis]|uniref:putative phage tail protein n=1 Tax=Apilactobacillus xinyiensis TaxID=2841032 RepID=UPI002010C30B|nr:putative phage tail protein [Apilactobacillus xinyiensis]MCL0330622.1 YmfQ family protein [Apilactobacillus xinyiensis]
MSDLKGALPEYYDNVIEMNALMDAEQGTYNERDLYINNFLYNLFVKTADSDGLSLFEKEYQIRVEKGSSLETRRYNVLLRMLPPHPITFNYFKELLSSFDIPVRLDEDCVNELFTAIDDNNVINSDQIKRLWYLMNKMLPVNLAKKILKVENQKSTYRETIGAKAISNVSNVSLAQLVTEKDSKLSLHLGTNDYRSESVVSKMKGSD